MQAELGREVVAEAEVEQGQGLGMDSRASPCRGASHYPVRCASHSFRIPPTHCTRATFAAFGSTSA